MIFEGHRADRRVHDAQILRAFTVTITGTWFTVLLFVWLVVPILGPETSPVIATAVARTGRKAPGTEKDVYLAVRENGHYYWSGEPVGPFEVEHRLRTLSLKPAQWSRQEIQVRVETNTPFGAVRRLTRMAQNAGVPRLVFMVRVAAGYSIGSAD